MSKELCVNSWTWGRAGTRKCGNQQRVRTDAAACGPRNLAEWLKHQGMLDQAAQLVEGVTADQPQFWCAWDRLGDLKVRLKRAISTGRSSRRRRVR